jgi:hypothetical protein
MAARAQVIVDQFAIDTDLFVHAHRSGTPEHARARKELPGPGLGDRRSSYVGHYTHRVAISNHRLIDIEDGHVRFRYKDYRADPSQTQKTMRLGATEFIRRFLLHVRF